MQADEFDRCRRHGGQKGRRLLGGPILERLLGFDGVGSVGGLEIERGSAEHCQCQANAYTGLAALVLIECIYFFVERAQSLRADGIGILHLIHNIGQKRA